MNEESRQVRIVPVGGVTVRMKPVGFTEYSRQFLAAGEAARAALGDIKFSPVPYYLYCRSLELILKAYLLLSGCSLDELKSRYGHNLVRLHERALEEGMADVVVEFPDGFDGDLKRANDYYNGKAFEYFDFGRWAHGYEGLPPTDRFEQAVKHLVSVLGHRCISEA